MATVEQVVEDTTFQVDRAVRLVERVRLAAAADVHSARHQHHLRV